MTLFPRRYGESDGERAAATAAAGRVRVVEREPGAHHRRNVVDLHAVEVLGTERIDEDPQPVHRDDLVVLLGVVLDVEAVLEPGAATRKNCDPKAGRLRSPLLFHELLYLG